MAYQCGWSDHHADRLSHISRGKIHQITIVLSLYANFSGCCCFPADMLDPNPKLIESVYIIPHMFPYLPNIHIYIIYVCILYVYIYIYMAVSINSGMDRSAVIRTMDRECLRKVPDPYPFVRAHHSIQIVLILLLSPTCYYFSSCYCCC